MEATFVGRLGQKVHMEGNPMSIATTYAYLMAADVQGIRAMDQSRLNQAKNNGGCTEPPYDLLDKDSPDEVIDGLLDWINDQRRKMKDGDTDGDE